MLKPYLAAGKIVGTHGVRGEVRVNPWCDTPAFLTQFSELYFDDKGNEKVTVLSSRVHGNVALLRIENVESIEQAQQLKNKMLYLKREDADLPQNTWFVEDLIGCKVKELDSNRVYGTISDVTSMPANDVWTIKASDGTETLVPVIKSVVINTDVENGIVEIKALKGLFDDIESVIEDEN